MNIKAHIRHQSPKHQSDIYIYGHFHYLFTQSWLILHEEALKKESDVGMFRCIPVTVIQKNKCLKRLPSFCDCGSYAIFLFLCRRMSGGEDSFWSTALIAGKSSNLV